MGQGRVLREKLIVSQLLKKFPTFYGTRSFSTAFTTARYFPLSWATSILFTLYDPYVTSILILSSRLHPGYTSGLFFSPFSPPKFCIALLLSPVYTTCPRRVRFLWNSVVEVCTQVNAVENLRVFVKIGAGMFMPQSRTIRRHIYACTVKPYDAIARIRRCWTDFFRLLGYYVA